LPSSQVGTVPWLLLGELCPSKTKGISSGVTVFIAFISIFAVVKFFPVSLDHLGPPATYTVFALVRHLLAILILTIPL
jgi:SP family arabinose:H+ symporter-like MFS transporter